MGNLADELADAYSDSGEEEKIYFAQKSSWLPSSPHQPESCHIGDGNTAATSEQTSRRGGEGLRDDQSTPESPKRFPRRRRSGNYYNEHGSESDLDSSGVSSSLALKIDTIGSLARCGTENCYSSADDAFRRLTNELRDLRSQSTIESSASRLITAHSALTMHLLHETRQLHGLMISLLSPLASPDSGTLDTLAPLFMSLCDDMPRPSTLTFNSLAALRTITTELIQTLSILSDTLHMSRQTTATASRKLRNAKDLVVKIRREEELRKEGERWISRGNWGERLQKRECAVVCGDVMTGFEDVCNGWRQQLLAQAESQAYVS